MSSESFLLEGIDKFPENNVKIFNRWGNLVWEADGYNNTSNAWNGDAIVGLFVNNEGERLPDGTYFYVVDLGNGTKPLSGFIVIKR